MQLKQNYSHKIKNIIFDFGAVIININYQLTTQAFSKLGVHNFNEMFSKANQSGLFDQLEKGLFTENYFCNQVRIITGLNITNHQINSAWNAMLLDLPEERITLITALKNNYKTFLLSNTNQIHANAFYKIIDHNIGITKFNNAFDKIYLSHEINLRKPDTEIFDFVLLENKLSTAETLFIDDSIQHIESAANIGLHTYHLKDGESIMELFE